MFAGLVGACWAFWGLRGLLVLTWLAGLVGFVGLAGACWACLDMLGLLDFLILNWLSRFAGPAGGHWGVLSLVKAALRTLANTFLNSLYGSEASAKRAKRAPPCPNH